MSVQIHALPSSPQLQDNPVPTGSTSESTWMRKQSKTSLHTPDIEIRPSIPCTSRIQGSEFTAMLMCSVSFAGISKECDACRRRSLRRHFGHVQPVAAYMYFSGLRVRHACTRAVRRTFTLGAPIIGKFFERRDGPCLAASFLSYFLSLPFCLFV